VADTRPVYLNLFKIRLPVTGIVSLAHRLSGVLLFLSLPVCVWLLERSVSSPEGFAQVMTLFSHLSIKLLGLVLFWSLAHHFFAGIRFLLLDIDIAVLKHQSIITAWLVLAAEIVTLAVIAWVWL
jgi:succinate dehydrogenase / fumarate reductase cytochrome b subunit